MRRRGTADGIDGFAAFDVAWRGIQTVRADSSPCYQGLRSASFVTPYTKILGLRGSIQRP